MHKCFDLNGIVLCIQSMLMKTEYLQLLHSLSKKQITKTAYTMRKWKKSKADEIIHALHERAFEEIDCLSCANCCKTTGPLLTSNDIRGIAKYLGLKPSEFETEYLRIDEDQDWVFTSMPCPFLDGKNYCSIYEVRPKACREYPHTDRKNQQGISKLTEKNAEICPAVAYIFKGLENV
jgi:Fe-S-cluster containining protein